MALYGAAKAPAVPKYDDGTTVDALTEGGAAIGGTNDGDLPSLTATAVDLTDNSGGTASDTIADLETTYTEATVANNFASLARAVDRLTADNVNLRAAIRENAAKINALIDHMNDGRT